MMSESKLVIGNRNYSSWSLRAWLALRHLGWDGAVECLEMDTAAFRARIRTLSPSGRVPVLLDGAVRVWDSLAICEYAAEQAVVPAWPHEAPLRAHARSAVAEMHSGFAAVRAELPMNVRARGRRVPPSAAARAELERLAGLWCEALSLHDGGEGWLYGSWSLADAFYAPVLLRLRTYGLPLPELCWTWAEQVFADTELAAWCDAAAREDAVIEHEEVGRESAETTDDSR